MQKLVNRRQLKKNKVERACALLEKTYGMEINDERERRRRGVDKKRDRHGKRNTEERRTTQGAAALLP